MSNAIVSSKNHLIGIKSLKFFSKRVDKIIGANIKKIPWPNNKKFAFTIFDDTDRSNLKDSKQIYDFFNVFCLKSILRHLAVLAVCKNRQGRHLAVARAAKCATWRLPEPPSAPLGHHHHHHHHY